MSLGLGYNYIWKDENYLFCTAEARKSWAISATAFDRRRVNRGLGLGQARIKRRVSCIQAGEHTKASCSGNVNNSKQIGVTVVNGSPGTGKFVGARTDSDDRGCAKITDVVTLGNLCVDIVLNVPSLPPPSLKEKYDYMQQLIASNPEKSCWEAGGNCNFAIAAARLGLHCVTLGQVGDDMYGQFLREVLEKEGVNTVGIDEDDHVIRNCKDYESVLCWVLVDPGRRHGFCSRFDFNREPAFNWIRKLPAKAEAVIKQSKVLFCNGFVFDELSPGLVVSALECARDAGSAIFFDPGPRNKALFHGTPEQRGTLQRFLSMSDVLLLTEDEAESLTGLASPVLAAQDLLTRGPFTKWVIIKMGSRGSLMMTSNGLYYAPAFKVDVADTVGCGDSFAAAIVLGYINCTPMITTLALANAVGGATAMGCGAGRNVATVEKVCEILLSSELSKGYEDYCKELLVQEHLTKSEIKVLVKKLINGQGNSVRHIAVQYVARDALHLVQKCSQERSLFSKMNA